MLYACFFVMQEMVLFIFSLAFEKKQFFRKSENCFFSPLINFRKNVKMTLINTNLYTKCIIKLNCMYSMWFGTEPANGKAKEHSKGLKC